MNRLTEKEKYGYASLETGQVSECSDKLGKLEDLEEEIGCPLDIFARLVLEREIWAETPEMHFEAGNYGSLVGSQKWEDRYWCEVDANFHIDSENYGNTVFWAWYRYCCNGSDHIELKLSDYGKLWWLEKDKSE